MLASVEMLEKERKRDIRKGIRLGRAEGEAQNKIKIAKKMLKENLDIELIEKITGLKREKFMK